MSISISGLPADALAPLMVTGPNGYHRAIGSSIRLDSLVVGDYVLHASATKSAGESYNPTVDSQSVRVSAGDVLNVQLKYLKMAHPASTDLPAHPRVWMTPARVAFLKAQAAANTPRWQKVKAGADAQLARGAAYQWQDAYQLPALCATYLGTGDARYAGRAGLVLAGFSTPDNTISGDVYYDFRSWIPIVTIGLDWCYNGLTGAERHQTASWLMDRADAVWPETNPARVGAWAVTDVRNNYYWGFMMTGPAALAAAGDDTGRGTISGSDRATYHQRLALSHWANVALPYFASDGAGGAGSEGTGYDISGRIAQFVDAFQTAGQGVSTPWLAQTMQWHLQTTMTGGRYYAPLGDQARVSTAPMYIYNRENMLTVLAVANAGSTLNAQAQSWLALIGQVPYALDDPNLVNELLYYDPSAPSVADFSGLPKSYLAPGAGDFIYRQSWTDPNATTLVFESGPLGESHTSDDANGLMIWKGSFWISANANISSHSGIEQATANYNNLTVGGNGQHNGVGANGGQIVGTQVSDALVVVRGQAKDAYGYPPGTGNGLRPVSDYLRTVAYLPQQDVFVIVDRATVVDPTQAKVWRWHVSGVPVIVGNTFTLSNAAAGNARCVGSVLLPSDAVLGTQAFNLGIAGAVSSYAVTVTLPTARASDVVVTVLQCTNALAAPLAPTATITGNQAIVTIGIHRVTVPLDEAQAVGFETAAIISDH